jgi:phytanoyl-CoA hydroxylase
MLTDYQKVQDDFARDGFLHVHGFMSPGEVNEIDANLARFIREIVPGLKKSEAMYEEHEKPETLKQITALTVDPFFSDLLSQPKIVDLARALLKDAVVPKGLQFFNKPPETGKPTPPHQDGYYYSLVPNEALTVWIALDDVDEENGAIYYFKGSHHKGVLPHNVSEVLGFSQTIAQEFMNELGEKVMCPVKRGDSLIHHSLTIHSAGGNVSPRSRRALGLVYYAERAKVDEAAHRRYQQSVGQQQRKIGLTS